MWQCSMPTDTCGTGQSKFARIVCCRADAKYADRSRADRTASVCLTFKCISEVLEKAREAGMSYGKYVAMMDGTPKIWQGEE